MIIARTLLAGSAVAFLATSPAARAASDAASPQWLPWLVLGAVALFVVGVVLRMFLAARFPKGYKAWAARRRDAFAANNEAWDRQDEDFRS
jgi:hypothetical protein